MNTVKVKRKKVGRRSISSNSDPEKKTEKEGQKADPVEDGEFVPPMVVDKDGVEHIALTREHLLQVELNLAQVQAAMSEAKALHSLAQLKEQEAALLVRSLRAEAMAQEKKAIEIKGKSDALWVKLSKMYGIDFKHAGYDDQTGLITVDPRREEDKKT